MQANNTNSSGGTSADGAIASMTAAFDEAIRKAAEITKIKTEKATAVDAAKQRPNN